ncbi:MAG: DNA-processing protein DprA [Bacillota bacterium]
MSDKKFSVWLTSLPGIGAKSSMALVKYFGSAEAVFESSYDDLIKSGVVTAEQANTIGNNKNIEKINSYMRCVKEHGIDIHIYNDTDYPENLKSIYDPPLVLYARGKIKKEDNLSVAIIGSRKASEYGLKTAEKLAYQLACEGVTIISGMALGIDSAAHRGALKAGGRTIAVFGCGLMHVYPRTGLSLCKDIIKNGAVVSEYPISFEARPEFFPARNRIVSGMSKAIIVVEAGLKSGTLITTDFALDQGRDVFAVPGSINSPNSKGTNNLIKNGAKLVDCVEDIIEELNIIKSDNTKNNNMLMENISLEEATVLSCIKDIGRSIEEIIRITGIETKSLMSAITMMEIKGLIIQANGTYYLNTET